MREQKAKATERTIAARAARQATIKERKFGSSELESAKAKFDDLAKKSASWIPYDALSPKYSIGNWCEVCEFKSTCLENR